MFVGCAGVYYKHDNVTDISEVLCLLVSHVH